MKIELDKTYSFSIDNIAFGDIASQRIKELFKDGRVAAPFLEEQLSIWFPQLTRVEGNKGYDHIDEEGRKYDAKNFTRNGLRFMPSSQIGAGRSFNADEAYEKVNTLVYICCDITEFPSVRVRFVDGSDLVKEYPSCTVPAGKREVLFG